MKQSHIVRTINSRHVGRLPSVPTELEQAIGLRSPTEAARTVTPRSPKAPCASPRGVQSNRDRGNGRLHASVDARDPGRHVRFPGHDHRADGRANRCMTDPARPNNLANESEIRSTLGESSLRVTSSPRPRLLARKSITCSRDTTSCRRIQEGIRTGRRTIESRRENSGAFLVGGSLDLV
jgi:hypothetical protein